MAVDRLRSHYLFELHNQSHKKVSTSVEIIASAIELFIEEVFTVSKRSLYFYGIIARLDW